MPTRGSRWGGYGSLVVGLGGLAIAARPWDIALTPWEWLRGDFPGLRLTLALLALALARRLYDGRAASPWFQGLRMRVRRLYDGRATRPWLRGHPLPAGCASGSALLVMAAVLYLMWRRAGLLPDHLIPPVLALCVCVAQAIVSTDFSRWLREQHPGVSRAAYPVAGRPLSDACIVFACYLGVIFDVGFQDGMDGGSRCRLLAFYSIALLLLGLLTYQLSAVHVARRANPLPIVAATAVLTWLAVTAAAYAWHTSCRFPDASAAAFADVAGFGAILSLVPFLVLAPAAVLAYQRTPADNDARQARGQPRAWRLVALHTQIAGARVLLAAILSQHVAFFAVTLPLTLVMAHGLLPHLPTHFTPAPAKNAAEPAKAGAEPVRKAVAEPIKTANTEPAKTADTEPPRKADAGPLDSWSAFFGVLLLWLAPFASSLYQLQETLAGAYARGIRRALAGAQGHLLIFGYGDPARRLLRHLLRRDELGYDNEADNVTRAVNVLLPDGRLAKVLTGIAAVDLSGHRLKVAVKDAVDLPVATADVTRFLPGGTDPEFLRDVGATVVIPAVHGDAHREEIQDAVGFDRAGFIASFFGAPPTEVVHPLLRRLADDQSQRIPAMLMLSASKQIAPLTVTAMARALPLHYLLPEHIEGINAGSRLYALYAKHQDLDGRSGVPTRILLCGRGRRLGYLLDAFLKSMTPEEFGRLQQQQKEHQVLRIIGPDAFIEKQARDSADSADGNTPAEPGIDVQRLITQVPPALAAQRRAFTATLRVPVSGCQAMDVVGLRKELRDWRPSAIVICEHSADSALEWYQALVNALTQIDRSHRAAVLPQILISAETGQEHISSHFENAFVHYTDVWLTAAEKATNGDVHKDARWYPSTLVSQDERELPAGAGSQPPADAEQRFAPLPIESFIDALEDPTERVAATFMAYRRAAANPAQTAIEAHICADDVGGSVATTLARLAGFRLERAPASGAPQELPSLREFRVVSTHGDRFEVRSLATLEDAGATLPDRAARRVAVVHQPRRSHAGAGEREPLEVLRDLLEIKHAEDGQRDQATVAARADCCGMPTCPVEGIQKVASAAANDALKTALTFLGQRHASNWPSSMREHARCHYVARGGLAKVPQVPCGLPLASLKVMCRASRRPGTFATALGVLQRLVPPTRANGPSDLILNLTGVAGYDCHDLRYTVYTCYGTLQPNNADQLPVIADVIEHIDICPVRFGDFKKWEAYAESLAAFLNDYATPRDGRKWVPDPMADNTRLRVQRASKEAHAGC